MAGWSALIIHIFDHDPFVYKFEPKQECHGEGEGLGLIFKVLWTWWQQTNNQARGSLLVEQWAKKTFEITKEKKIGFLIKSERVFDGGAISYFSATFPFFCAFTSCHPQTSHEQRRKIQKNILLQTKYFHWIFGNNFQ